ncbi:BBP7 family outer membrane beta-barrel protein [Aporhodopirellula aestuarii]|uniref:BBP7 family outer membrane beta-barrel protein n=1 Tax=Aporhodopirellula aestuarii TaxID=2950107 RepID=A0ABT0U7P1_9BACT|nr:BBP7 family outer membrane beta-barrel protein [Aporhodopirellula aestuarii]MCM2372944.1 BBP7 family outer membrane beta-barrel protein [Aporhodopirellula aestuarii]
MNQLSERMFACCVSRPTSGSAIDSCVARGGMMLGFLLAGLVLVPATATAQVRTKRPDRGTYNPVGPSTPPPTVRTQPVSTQYAAPEAAEDGADENTAQGLVEPISLKPLPSMVRRNTARVHATSDSSEAHRRSTTTPQLREVRNPKAIRLSRLDSSDRALTANGSVDSPIVQPASFEAPHRIETAPRVLHAPQNRRVIGSQLNPSGMRPTASRGHGRTTLIQHQRAGGEWIEENVVGSGAMGWTGEHWEGEYGVSCDSCGGAGCGSCDGLYGGCDGYCDDGCDSCGHYGHYLHHANASLSFDPCRWFASFELLLLFREGDLIPSLITTSPEGTLGGVAGELPGATTLFGGENFFNELTAGGRLTLGTWLDNQQCRSLVFRGWTATESSDSFAAREAIDSGGILAVPTTTNGAADAILIAFPDSTENFGRFGSVSASASSNVFGGDVSVRQFWTGGLGTTFDVFYGYQYMRLQEDLQLSTSSTKTQDPFPDAIGTNLTTSDSFDTLNEFHGGQLGIAGRYREGCWSFDWLGKVGFGQVRRKAELRGQSVITTDIPPASVSDSGLLISDANSGTYSDNTFGWAPEFDMSIGWHKYPRYDVTFGYNIIAMTDAIRLSGVMDPDNTVDTPRSTPVDETFVLQGIHFGIRHVY